MHKKTEKEKANTHENPPNQKQKAKEDTQIIIKDSKNKKRRSAKIKQKEKRSGKKAEKYNNESIR